MTLLPSPYSLTGDNRDRKRHPVCWIWWWKCLVPVRAQRMGVERRVPSLSSEILVEQWVKFCNAKPPIPPSVLFWAVWSWSNWLESLNQFLHLKIGMKISASQSWHDDTETRLTYVKCFTQGLAHRRYSISGCSCHLKNYTFAALFSLGTWRRSGGNKAAWTNDPLALPISQCCMLPPCGLKEAQTWDSLLTWADFPEAVRASEILALAQRAHLTVACRKPVQEHVHVKGLKKGKEKSKSSTTDESNPRIIEHQPSGQIISDLHEQ